MLSAKSEALADDSLQAIGRTRFACVGSALFLAFGLVRLWLHEPWRDECNPWVLALDCPTLGDLYRYIRYEGHTYYLFVIAWCLAQFCDSFLVMQTLHLLTATFAGYLILRYAPWPRWEAALCLCGYFLSYEYAILCRPYVGAVIGVVLIAMAWGKRADRYWLGGAGMFLLTQTSIYGVILALALTPALAVVAWQRRRDRTLTAGWCTGWLLPLAVGVVLSVLMIVPPAGSDPTNNWYFKFNPLRVTELATRLWHVLAPLPNPRTPYLWNSNIVEIYGLRTGTVLGVLSIAAVLWFLRRELAPFLIFLTTVVGVSAFCYMKYFGWPRHHGHVFLALFLALWIVSTHRGASSPTGVIRFRRGLFAIQAVAGIWLGVFDCLAPFSANQQSAEFIASGDYSEHLLVAHGAPAVSGVVMRLRRPIYYLNREHNRWGTFLIWDRNEYRCQLHTSADVFRAAAKLGDETQKPVLLVLTGDAEPLSGFCREAAFTNSMIRDESFFLYARLPAAEGAHESGNDKQISSSSALNSRQK